ncbi:MAG: PAS domain S-box protein [Hymenobacteraceae bacterium]|nr:PAS domain S-box protein [Hymenobacteraceae bacterium]MDX5480060.1 PAS domain S-box protein [Hymenobacteraceae bacterium]
MLNPDGNIVLANQQTEAFWGKPRHELVGQAFERLFEREPYEDLYTAMQKAAVKRNSVQGEIFLKGLNKWADSTVTPTPSGVMLYLRDITLRKKTEEEARKNLALLQQSEELAGMGSWEYDLSTKAFSWSEGMYRLFGLHEGIGVSPDIYLDFALQEDRQASEKVVEHILSGQASFEESLRIVRNGKVVTLKVKGDPVVDSLQNTVKMLGVDLDITNLKRLEEENLTLKLEQQKELLLAILKAQEEERKRIAEALHNGLAQLLYAISLYLKQLNVNQEASEENNTDLKHQIEHLLTEAINEARTISYELTPSVLRDFGLEMAVAELGKKLSVQLLKISLDVYQVTDFLSDSLQTVSYRIIQELINNAIKHADASSIKIMIRQVKSQLQIIVKDNGKGMAPEDRVQLQGIGLRSIKNQLKLLGGYMHIESVLNKGTTVKVVIPLKTS